MYLCTCCVRVESVWGGGGGGGGRVHVGVGWKVVIEVYTLVVACVNTCILLRNLNTAILIGLAFLK